MVEKTYLVFVPGADSPLSVAASVSQLREALAAGWLPPTAMASEVGGTKWVPISEVVSPVDDRQYQVTVDGQSIVGPVSFDQLRRGLDGGEVPSDARARRVGSESWIPVLEVIGARVAKPGATTP